MSASHQVHFVILDDILWYEYISKGGHIILEAQKVSTAVMNALPKLLSNVCPLCMLRLLQSFGKIGNLIYHC
jgi:hypothetical protein